LAEQNDGFLFVFLDIVTAALHRILEGQIAVGAIEIPAVSRILEVEDIDSKRLQSAPPSKSLASTAETNECDRP
jgi:hypothetical protein